MPDLRGSTAPAHPATSGGLIDLPSFVQRACEMYSARISYFTIWSAITRGELPAVRVGSRWLVDERPALEALPAAIKLPIATDAA